MKIKDAKSFKDRLLGLMFKKNITYGLSFDKCRAVHTFFMRENIDIYALDSNNKLIKEYHDIKPWKIIIAPKNTKKIIEMPSKK